MEIQANITSDLDKKIYKHYVKVDEIDEEIVEADAAAAVTAEIGSVIDGGNFNSIKLNDESPIISTTNLNNQDSEISNHSKSAASNED